MTARDHLRLVDAPPAPKPKRPRRRKWKLRHVSQQVDERTYPSGHVWRVDREHVANVLRARAMIGFGEGMRRG